MRMKMILLTEGETMSRLFDLDWQLLADSCLMIIAIFVLFLALSYFLFNPARKFLNDRKEKIRGELEEAKTSQEKAAELKEQYEAKLKDIDKEAEDILSDARRRALQNEERIVAQAKEEAGRILARAQEEARLEKQKMSDEIKQEIVSVASVMAGGMVPPIAIALCTTLFKRKFTKKECQSGLVNYIMGLSFITEGAIPFAASDPLRIIPSCAVGAAVAGGLSMFFGCTLRAPHGGIFVLPTIGNPLGYLAAIVIGSAVGCLILSLLKKNLDEAER